MMKRMERHSDFMRAALREAELALATDDVPVGAIVACEGRIVATGRNTREADRDPLGHAELSALKAASVELDRWRLAGCTLYVTLEPCPMCAAAAVEARVDRIVFGAYDPKLGACGSVLSLAEARWWNHRLEVIGGILEAESAALLRKFFEERRA